MTKPYFRSTPEHVPRRGSTSSKAGLDVPRRVAALEQGAGHKLAPSIYCAAMYAANSGSPTHTSNGGYQKVGSGGGTLTWTSAYDYRPTDISAQVDTATNKRLDVRRSGLYHVTASVSITNITDQKTLIAAVYVSGSATVVKYERASAAGIVIARISEYIQLSEGAYLELYAYQNDSVSEDYLVSNAYYNRIGMHLIGPPA